MFAIGHIMRFCLALILALTVSHATVTRNQGATIAGWVMLCAGDEVVSVAVDAKGVPVTPHLPCADCVMAGIATLPAAPIIARPVLAANRASATAPALFATLLVMIAPAARGPPAFV